MLSVINPQDIYSPIGPYAQAIEARSFSRILFISGTMGLQPDGSLAGDFEAQAKQIWSNIEATLRAADMTRTNLAKVTIWLANRDDWRRGAQIRQLYLGDHKVTMSVVEAGLVDSAWLMEVDAIAVA